MVWLTTAYSVSRIWMNLLAVQFISQFRTRETNSSFCQWPRQQGIPARVCWECWEKSKKSEYGGREGKKRPLFSLNFPVVRDYDHGCNFWLTHLLNRLMVSVNFHSQAYIFTVRIPETISFITSSLWSVARAVLWRRFPFLCDILEIYTIATM